jgi:hypothetical protein
MTAVYGAGAAPDAPAVLVTDSLWCTGVTIAQLQRRRIHFAIATRTNNGLISDALLSVAGSDLPRGCARTYTNDSLVLQVTGVGNHETGVVTDVWRAARVAPPPARRLLSWETACAMYRNDKEADIVTAFGIPPEKQNLAKHLLIYEAIAWDVLRSKALQGSSNPLSYDEACKA